MSTGAVESRVHWLRRILWVMGIGALTKTSCSPAMRDCFSSYSRDEIFKSSICAYKGQHEESGLTKLLYLRQWWSNGRNKKAVASLLMVSL